MAAFDESLAREYNCPSTDQVNAANLVPHPPVASTPGQSMEVGCLSSTYSLITGVHRSLRP
jgi:hypothetical protein